MMRAVSNMGEYMSAVELYLKLAMRAQSQCRNTWEAVSAIQNPPITNYAKQLNVAENQLVNNGTAPHTEEKEIAPNQQAEESNELLQDKRNEGATIPVDSPMEAVGEVLRPKDKEGQD